MNFELSYIPSREPKPRSKGLTMVMDKGLSAGEAVQFVASSGEYTDLLKFGFGTALITRELQEKLNIYRKGNLKPYFGGTLFEMFLVRGEFDNYRKMLDKYKMEYTEISDGSIHIPHEEKLRYIEILSGQVTVISEVGSKIKGVHIPPKQWVAMMQAELSAGAWKVIAEARESGNIGIYNENGTANEALIDDIINNVNTENIIWEAPVKSQQVWFIKLLGANVNLGNIPPNEVVALEALRLGLRGDTFYEFLPEEMKKFKP
ncbi:MAG: phosphosulfolactate synthase [Bacteroidales bacterium]|jgi:phosphosulfolactate synthase|nr:phosphosulfolactate synthase [Bacteroidales bacterium]